MTSTHPRQGDPAVLGRIVMYRAAMPGAPIVPAIVTGTPDSVRGAADVPPLPAAHLHLTVLTPQAGVLAVGGTIAALDIVEDDHEGGFYVEAEQTNGTWRWPDFTASSRPARVA